MRFVSEIVASCDFDFSRSFDLRLIWIRDLFRRHRHVSQNRMLGNLFSYRSISFEVGERSVQLMNGREQIAKLSLLRLDS